MKEFAGDLVGKTEQAFIHLSQCLDLKNFPAREIERLQEYDGFKEPFGAPVPAFSFVISRTG